MKKPYFNECQVERTFLRKYGTLSMRTGEIVYEREEVVTEACGTPLFGEDHKTGVCRSCLSGWEVEGNKITDKGWATIHAAAAAKVNQ